MIRSTSILSFAILLAAFAGCDDAPAGDDAPEQPDGGTWTGRDLAGPCKTDQRVGGFLVELGLANYVDGEIKDGVAPNTVLDEVMKEGDCVLLKRDPPFCTPACDGTTEVCGNDQQCHPIPRNQALGQVTVSGLAHAVAMDADGQGHYSDTTFTGAPFVEGALVQLDSAGSASVPAFRLRGVGVLPLALPVLEWVITPHQPLEVKWTKGTRDDMRVHVRINVDQHGNTPISLECDAADTGALTIPAALIDALLGAGQSGVPNAKIERRTVDSKDVGPGCADLVVRSRVGEPQLKLRVEGVDYCTPPKMCPPGKTCNAQFICE